MTKKDYIKISKLIDKYTLTSSNDGYKFIGFREDFIGELGDILQEDNPLFDKKRFEQEMEGVRSGIFIGRR